MRSNESRALAHGRAVTSLTRGFAAGAAMAMTLGVAACHEHGKHDHGAASPAHDHAHATTATPPKVPSAPAQNPVQHEMRLLLEAMQQVVAGIALGDVRAVPDVLHRVHAAKEDTAAALSSGSYEPPKNGDDVARFTAMDEAFHGELVKLVQASAKNDIAATVEAFSATMRGCDGCHTEFRK